MCLKTINKMYPLMLRRLSLARRRTSSASFLEQHIKRAVRSPITLQPLLRLWCSKGGRVSVMKITNYRAAFPALKRSRAILRRTFLRVPAPKKPDDRQFKVGDKIRVNLHHGKIEVAVVRAVIQLGSETKLQVDVIGLDLTALIDTRQVVND